jgi:hypothetical protein
MAEWKLASTPPRLNSMTCERKTRLGAEYEAATRKFAAAVSDLQRKIGTSLKEEYARLDLAAYEARLKSEQARQAIEQHIAAHGC